MSKQPRRYVVRQGDTLLRIALTFGLEPERIWREPKNAALIDKRDPDMLAPGDVLYLPPPPPPSLRVTPKTSNKFRAKLPEIEIRIAFHSERGPLAGERYELTGIAQPPINGQLDGLGALSVKVPVDIEELELTLVDRNVKHTISVGHLDPIDEPTGVEARLIHLGYGPIGQADPFVFGGDESLARAVEAFQRGHDLEPTGNAGETTQHKLRDVHGC